MSLTKRLYFDQIEADAPETRLANVSRLVSRAYKAACNDVPDNETLDTIARTLYDARQELNALAASIAALESTI